MVDWTAKRIVITGAAGSIGTALVDHLLSRDSYRLLLIDNSENALWRIESKLAEWPIEFRLGDVRDYPRMLRLFNEFKPHVVFHCAALKHVPMCERDHDEADKTNRNGTGKVADAAGKCGAEAMILISTDKAADPVCVLGKTKLAAEKIMSRMRGKYSSTVFASVRFHNVIGSSGSVVDRFAEQIANGWAITITHPDMVRWFSTGGDVCERLVQCVEYVMRDELHDLYALKVGKLTRIVDLAKAMIGDRDIEIRYTGLRPGERLEEKLVGKNERAVDVGVDGIFAIERVAQEAQNENKVA